MKNPNYYPKHFSCIGNHKLLDCDKSSYNSMSSRIEALTIKEDLKKDEPEDDEGLIAFPYDHLKISYPDHVSDIDVTSGNHRNQSLRRRSTINKGKNPQAVEFSIFVPHPCGGAFLACLSTLMPYIILSSRHVVLEK